ncbi:Gfo/Idh/MocA family protein [Arundinibacter roseus]|uniref:Gfo/Idh/MocA family oxidoreductase n=1 Tax=Arundinibacter roseus TaxID=2070510 RepID=A0A4R4KBD5_9BACT|nr:Gfo/Idh/MocA family oxidoreductase [Arundinibacter roseus]TDB65100.1 Gfo/Idh/MocA family oxidoreductase [Arundinibacter roseus]
MDKIKNVNRRDFLKAGAVLTSFMIVPRRVLGGPGFLAPSDLISLGFIGCGKQSGGLRKNFLESNQTQIIGACDVYQNKREVFTNEVNKWYASKNKKETYTSCTQYEDFQELLAHKDLDAVVIVLPDHWHAAAAVRAAEAGKDIYCEKPLSLTIPEGRAMVNATRKHKRVFQTGSMQRSWKEFRQAAQLVQSGAIGEVKQVIVNVGGPPKPWDLQPETTPQGLNWDLWMGPNTVDRPFNNQLAPPLDAKFWPQWRAYTEFGGGGMTDWGAHMFDIAQWGLGMDESGPVQVIAPGAGQTQGLKYVYENGVEMIHKTMEGKQHCHFIGTEGEVWVARGELRTTPGSLKDKPFAADEYKVYVSENHYGDFLGAIKSRKNPICDVEVGHRTASVCTIGNIAYQLQQTLTWDPAKEQFTGNKEANKLLKRPMKKEWKV